MDPQDVRAALRRRLAHRHLAVEAARAEERGVEEVGAVGGADEDDARVGGEAVHLRQQLVQGLLALLVAAHQRRRALRPQRVDLVHEDQARGVDAGALEKVADARGAHAHDDLHELGAAHGVEGHPRLARHRLGDERLPAAGAALQQEPLRRPRPHRVEALGILEERHHLLELLHGGPQRGDVLEGHPRLPLLACLRPRLGKLHRLHGVHRDPRLLQDAHPDGAEQEPGGGDCDPRHVPLGEPVPTRRLVVPDVCAIDLEVALGNLL
mmetsp:Transcript_34489/g.75424  ORF Transcript_34489/g.75424 Transcript_34489/m.75424 type:complete len:267 (-) Transcript_34489:696-1496(-)